MNDKMKNKIKNHFKKYMEKWLLGLILSFGFFLRIFKLQEPPLWVDEAISSIASKNILIKFVPILDSGMLYSRAYFFHYIQAFFLMFKENDFFTRFPSVIFGVLTIYLGYKIGKEYSKSGGILTALFMSVFYLEVFYSRQARFYQLFQLMFFASIYFLYKSYEPKKKKQNITYLIFALISLLICIDTQIAGLVLAPFFVLHILYFNRPRYLAIIPAIPLIQKIIPAKSLASGTKESAMNYSSSYFEFARNIHYMLIIVIPGVIFSFYKKFRLSILIVVPSIILLLGVFTLKTFALRYAYFIVFPLVLYFSLTLAYLYDKYGNSMLIAIFAVLIIPSNLIYPFTAGNIINPIDYNFYDYSAPEINMKNIPAELMIELQNENNKLISFFSSSVEWYIRKPDYVIPFTMDGRAEDQISYNNSQGRSVDVYSGAEIYKEKPNGKYYVIEDYFSVTKLKPKQRERYNLLIKGCEIVFQNSDVKIRECNM
ncbi:MAG: glycosyltransferase family 39 protein [Candidatus Pacearchaeota archaeon]|jgi:hypothetical protein